MAPEKAVSQKREREKEAEDFSRSQRMKPRIVVLVFPQRQLDLALQRLPASWRVAVPEAGRKIFIINPPSYRDDGYYYVVLRRLGDAKPRRYFSWQNSEMDLLSEDSKIGNLRGDFSIPPYPRFNFSLLPQLPSLP